MFPVSYAKASVLFTEVMYDPAGSDDKHEWIEVYNNGSSSVDLTKYYLQTDGVSSSYHTINAVGSSTMLPGQTYAIIAQDPSIFLTDQIGFGGLLFDSSWSDLSDSVGKNLVINDTNKVLLDQYTYNPSLGASNDGNSLQKDANGVWGSSLPTPGTGKVSENFVDNNTTGGLSSNDTNASVSVSTSSVQKADSKIPQAVLSFPKISVAGVAVNIVPSLVNVNNIISNHKSFHVSFGDGSDYYNYSPDGFSHTYKYPGTYVVYFEYAPNPYNANDPEKLSVRKTIEIAKSVVAVDHIDVDASVEIVNPDSREIDVSGWQIRSLSNPDVYYIIPNNTIILSGKKIIFPKEVTGFDYNKIRSLEISLPSGVPVSVYDDIDYKEVANNTLNKSIIAQARSLGIVPPNKNVANKQTSKKYVASYSTTLSSKDLENQTEQIPMKANALSSVDKNKSNNSYPFIPIAVGFFAVVIISVYVVRSLHFGDVGSNVNIVDYENSPAKDVADQVRIVEE